MVADYALPLAATSSKLGLALLDQLDSDADIDWR